MTAMLALRVDANDEIGAGHLMRCLALAQAWQDTGGQCTFLLRDTAPYFVERLRREAMSILCLADNDPQTAVFQATRIQSEWLVLDGYRFDSDYQAELAAGPVPILALDDNGEAGRYTARLILNQNGHAAPSLYETKASDVELLLGLDYTLLRREFRRARPRLRLGGPVRNVLVTLGGADDVQVISTVVDTLLEEMETSATCTVVTNAFVPPASPRVSACHRVENMAALMSEADFAVTAGGSTIFEAAALGLPALPLILAENQDRLAHHLAKSGGCFTPIRDLALLRRGLQMALVDDRVHADIRTRGPQLIKRNGATRVISCMRRVGMRLSRSGGANTFGA